MADLSKICPGCMKNKGEAAVCPHCGYQAADDRSPQLLPYWTVLNKRFLLGRVLGEPGGFGITYLGWDLSLHTTVAIKEFFPSGNAIREPGKTTVRIDGSENRDVFSGGLEGFLQEARMLAKFRHPNIVRVRDFFQENNTAYLVMDYYEGVSLAEFVQRNGGRIPDSLALKIIKPILLGLKEVHQAGFLHRDIKPANIYITKDGTPVLLDFGSARFAMGEKTTTLSVVLSPGYAPLEQYHQKGHQGPWTDIYSVAATLYFMVTGEVPQNCLERIQQDELLRPDKLNPEVGVAFSATVIRGLDMEATRRPQSVDDLFRLLDSQQTMTVQPDEIPHVIPKAAGTHAARQIKPKRGSISALQFMILLIGVAAGLLYLMISKPFSTPASIADNPPPAEVVPETLVPGPKGPPSTPVKPQSSTTARQATEKSAVNRAVMVEKVPKPPESLPELGPAVIVSDPSRPDARRSTPMPMPPAGERSPPRPPEGAIRVCSGKRVGTACSLRGPHGNMSGECRSVQGVTACIPGDHLRRHQVRRQ